MNTDVRYKKLVSSTSWKVIEFFKVWRIDCPLTPLLKGIHDFPKLFPQSGQQSFLVRLLGGQPPALFLLSQAKQIHWATF